MNAKGKGRYVLAGAIVLAAIAALGAWFVLGGEAPISMPLTATNIPTDLITHPIDDGAQSAQLSRGQYMLRAGDCMVCHTRKGGAPFSGGYALNTPFGVIFSSNLTPDPDTGIGKFDADEFYASLHEGSGPHGPLYPAMPYTAFTKISRSDSDAMYAYLKTIPAVKAAKPANNLPFPLNIRFFIHFWNALNFIPGTFAPDASKSLEWNRGAYLVQGPGHCGACHTPKNILAGNKNDKAYQGGLLDNWFAPDLTPNTRTGLGTWSIADITEYLKTGRNAHANAAGPMADVVTYSTSLLSDNDLRAIATYLKTVPEAANVGSAMPDAAVMKHGAAIYSDTCASCHMQNGVGQSRFFPPLRNDGVSQQTDPTTLLHLILAGGRTAPTQTRPTALAMPTFAWKLSDQEIADVASYVRNSWGNRAASVTAKQVSELRKAIALTDEGGRVRNIPGTN